MQLLGLLAVERGESPASSDSEANKKLIDGFRFDLLSEHGRMVSKSSIIQAILKKPGMFHWEHDG